MANKKFTCPLCDSILTENKYLKIVGVWEEQAKAKKAIEEKLKDAERQKKDIIQQQKETLKKMQQQSKLAIKDGIEKGKEKEKKRANRLSLMVQKQTADLQNANSQIKALQKHLKDGTTPQDAGRDFEKELIKQLQKEFPLDKVAGTPG